MKLTPTVEKFVLHWGEMGTRWGVNRSVAQIHALLYLSPTPLHAEEISKTLAIARSNVSVSVRELQGYELISVAHVLGDRRDHFQADTDPWSMFLKIAEARKRREIDPTLTILRDCLLEAEQDSQTDAATKARIVEMLGFVEQLSGWYADMKRVPRTTLERLIGLGSGIIRLVGG